MELNCVVKIIDRTSKAGHPYSVAQIWVDEQLVKGDVFLTDAEKTLFNLLSR